MGGGVLLGLSVWSVGRQLYASRSVISKLISDLSDAILQNFYIYVYIFICCWEDLRKFFSPMCMFPDYRYSNWKESKQNIWSVLYIQVSAFRITLLLCDLTFSADWTVLLLSIYNSLPLLATCCRIPTLKSAYLVFFHCWCPQCW